MGDKISIIEMKRIAKEIIANESKKYGIDINIRPITFVDIINPKLFKDGNYTIDKRRHDLSNYINLRCGGYNDLKGTTVIFLDKLDRISHASIGNMFLLVNTCYHEARHSVQQTFDRFSYERFLLDMEIFSILGDSYSHYKRNHDEYYSEIDANLYSIRMAREYLRSNYPEIYKKDKKRIDLSEKYYLVNLKLYNSSYFIDRVIPRIKTLVPTYSSDISKSNFIKNISPVLSIFLNDNGSFKRPREVINNDIYQEIDKRILYIIFSSLSYLDELRSMVNLSLEEINIIDEAIEYAIRLCRMQLSYYEGLLVMSDENIIQQEVIKKKITYLMMYLSKYERIKTYLNSLPNNNGLVKK